MAWSVESNSIELREYSHSLVNGLIIIIGVSMKYASEIAKVLSANLEKRIS